MYIFISSPWTSEPSLQMLLFNQFNLSRLTLNQSIYICTFLICKWLSFCLLNQKFVVRLFTAFSSPQTFRVCRKIAYLFPVDLAGGLFGKKWVVKKGKLFAVFYEEKEVWHVFYSYWYFGKYESLLWLSWLERNQFHPVTGRLCCI